MKSISVILVLSFIALAYSAPQQKRWTETNTPFTTVPEVTTMITTTPFTSNPFPCWRITCYENSYFDLETCECKCFEGFVKVFPFYCVRPTTTSPDPTNNPSYPTATETVNSSPRTTTPWEWWTEASTSSRASRLTTSIWEWWTTATDSSRSSRTTSSEWEWWTDASTSKRSPRPSTSIWEWWTTTPRPTQQ